VISALVIQHGAVGDDEVELKARPQYLGFYNRKINGVFGLTTYWALRNFQYEFGLNIDRLAGGTTKAKLTKASQYDEKHEKSKKFKHYSKEGKKKQSDKQATTASVNVPSGYSQNDINLMANAVHGEARGEPYEGQVAVAAVILNRVESSTFPNNVAGVIFEPR